MFVTQRVDAGHPSLAPTVPKLRALADRVDELVVVAQEALPAALPRTVRVKTFGARSRPARARRFVAALAPELRGGTAVVAHMIPLYVLLAAPLALPRRVPVLLWFVQSQPTAALRVAARLATRILTVERGSFPLDSAKVTAIGHGIDVAAFPCRERRGNGELRLVAIGRYSAAKGYADVLRAVRLAVDAGTTLRLDVHGPELSESERAHRAELERLLGDLRLAGRVALHGPVEPARVPEVLAAADALVNNMVETAADKIVFEACASCVPAFASSSVFASLLPDALRFSRDEPADLARKLAAFAAVDPEHRAALGLSLRDRVVAGHSVESWADAVVRNAFE